MFLFLVFHFVNIGGWIVTVELAIQDYQANRTEGATRPKEFVEFTTPAPPPALAQNCLTSAGILFEWRIEEKGFSLPVNATKRMNQKLHQEFSRICPVGSIPSSKTLPPKC